jgi:hypothetical protein
VIVIWQRNPKWVEKKFKQGVLFWVSILSIY